MDKTVKFADKSNKDSKDSIKTCKIKLLKLITRRLLHLTLLVRSKLVISIKTDIDKYDSDSISWNNLPDIVLTSGRSDTGHIDETE